MKEDVLCQKGQLQQCQRDRKERMGALAGVEKSLPRTAGERQEKARCQIIEIKSGLINWTTVLTFFRTFATQQPE